MPKILKNNNNKKPPAPLKRRRGNGRNSPFSACKMTETHYAEIVIRQVIPCSGRIFAAPFRPN
jgi:hypothetical protein